MEKERSVVGGDFDEIDFRKKDGVVPTGILGNQAALEVG